MKQGANQVAQGQREMSLPVLMLEPPNGGFPFLILSSLPELIGQKKSKLFVYHQNGLPKKYKVHELRA